MVKRPSYVFVGGLHRSGTSLLAGLIGQHPDIGTIEGAPVPEQEGVYLQGAIAHTARHGVPGDFAHDPDQHLTELSPCNTLETATRLTRDWDGWFQPGTPWRIEKSPVNLLRARLYQQLFPMAHFIFLVRHPLAVSRATAKWSGKTESELLEHWQAAYQIVERDLSYLHCALVLRYEDLCAAPAQVMDRVAAFLALDPAPFHRGVHDVHDGNARYLDAAPAGPLPEIAGRLGYGPDGVRAPMAEGFACRHVFRSIREAVDP
ncbi:sulfotransferase family protein [Pontivivens nitratireducens]|jgi:hypothetical protein|uniref:sulfotransferase family protein n=1 Tax=Pontivivens nitratireducens TaxID=2758038 RepID=UPI00163B5022|nr:sulfotransferase [Pontibrevibacter nitratireducens]